MSGWPPAFSAVQFLSLGSISALSHYRTRPETLHFLLFYSLFYILFYILFCSLFDLLVILTLLLALQFTLSLTRRLNILLALSLFTPPLHIFASLLYFIFCSILLNFSLRQTSRHNSSSVLGTVGRNCLQAPRNSDLHHSQIHDCGSEVRNLTTPCTSRDDLDLIEPFMFEFWTRDHQGRPP